MFLVIGKKSKKIYGTGETKDKALLDAQLKQGFSGKFIGYFPEEIILKKKN